MFRPISTPLAAFRCFTGRGNAGLWMVVVLCLFTVRGQAAPAPGTIITNTADIAYVDAASSPVSLSTNTVELTVSAPAVTFEFFADATYYISGATVLQMPHTLRNPSSQSETVRLTFGSQGGHNYNLNSLRLIYDANGNGVADAGEPEISAGNAAPIGLPGQPSVSAASTGPVQADTITVQPGQSLQLLLVGQAPTGLASGATSVSWVKAALLSTTQSITLTDTVIVSQPVITLRKSASPAAAKRNETITYTITGNNAGGSVTPLNITLDGQPRTAVVLHDVIPANTTYRAVRDTGSAPVGFHYTGEPANVYHSAEPTNRAQVDEIVVLYSTFGAAANARLVFEATVNQNASGPVRNTARLTHRDGMAEASNDSNPAVVQVELLPPVLTFYRDPNFTRTTNTGHLGTPLHLQVDAATCNINPLVVESVTIVVDTALTGDRESYIAVETGPNTGIFRVQDMPTADSRRVAVVRGDGILESITNDSMTATIEGCGGTITSLTLLIDPSGIVFDSRTCKPVAGARVTLIDVTGEGNGGRPGEPAIVFLADSVTPTTSSQITGADGRYEFPLLGSSTYRLQVEPPVGAVFPTQIPLAPCAATLRVRIGSDGTPFRVDLDTGAVFIDIPVDTPIEAGGFVLHKESSRQEIQVGDSVLYTLKLENTTALPLQDVMIEDRLPNGFTYIPGSTRLNGAALTDPTGGRGPLLTFATQDLAPLGKAELTYLVRAEQLTPEGDAVNQARAHTAAGVQASSNLATATVRVEAGVFTDKGVVIGKVFLDANANDIQDQGEPGVSGVRLYLEDGNYVITDADGKYSFYGVRPIAHALKLDATTLPAGAELRQIDTRDAGQPGLRFVDLKAGELHKANFALAPKAGLAAAIAERREKHVDVPEIENALRQQLQADASNQQVGDTRSLPASGLIQGGQAQDSGTGTKNLFTALLPEGTLTDGNSALPPAAPAPVASVSLETLVENISDNHAGFIGLNDGDTTAVRQTAVRVKGPLGASFSLLLNDHEVSARRVGKKVTSAHHQAEAWEYLGLDLSAGANTLELIVRDPFGNERARKKITITAPDTLAVVKLGFSTTEPYADGRTPVKVRVQLVDSHGVLVSARTPLTLTTDLGRWQTEDLDPEQPGTQVFIEGGRGEYALLPPSEPGAANIQVTSGVLVSNATLPFLPELRPLIASGILEGRLQLKGFSLSSLNPVTPADAFENELTELSSSEDLRASGRAAFFLKGKIKGDLLLTAAYDSSKDRDGELFRDIQPDKYYPVYGDSAARGFDAQSSGSLYVRVDHRRSYLLLGDFNTQSRSNEVRALGAYSRSLNGVRAHVENNRLEGNVFASQDTTRQIVREIPANGTSGPFEFGAGFGRVNSETVEILTRDRDQPSVILATKRLQRYVDYEFEPFTGRILFYQPISSVDINFNPQSIRFTYEYDLGGEPFWVYGADGQLRVNDRLEVGGSYVREEEPANEREIGSVNATVKLATGTYVISEFAATDTVIDGLGYAGRVDLRHKSEKTEARIYYGQTSEHFSNQSSLLSRGRVEAGIKATQQLPGPNRLTVQALRTEDAANSSSSRQGVRADVAHTFTNNIILEFGARWSEETITPAGASTAPGALTPHSTNPAGVTPDAVTPFEVHSLRLKASTELARLPDTTVFAEYEQDVVESDQRMVAVGGEMKFKRGRLYGRHEIISALGGPFELNQTQENNTTMIGFESDYMKGGRVFNEFRTRNPLYGSQSEASTGVRNSFDLASGLKLTAGLERVTPFDGDTQNESTSATTGVEYTANPKWKASARLETRWANSSDSILNTLGYARKINPDWTFLTKTIYSSVTAKGDNAGNDLVQARILTGVAWRPAATDVWQGLLRYEYRYEDGVFTGSTLSALRNVNIISSSLNWQPTEAWVFSARLAGKHVDERIAGISDRYFGSLLSFHALYDVTDRWDAGLNVSVGASRGFDRHYWVIGPEVGYNFRRNMRVGLGYNFAGFYDRDLASDISTTAGLFLTMRIKFDEDLFGLARLIKPDED